MLIGDPKLQKVTHVLLDEVHERDRHSDFLLILLREVLKRRPDLRVILMSATLHANLFTSYFSEFRCGRIHIPGFTFPVETAYLSTALKLTGFKAKAEEVVEEVVHVEERPPVGQDTLDAYEEALQLSWHATSAELEGYISQLQYFILSEGVPVDHAHSITGVTALMIVAAKGNEDGCQAIMRAGANVQQTARNGFAAAAFAQHFGFPDIVAVLSGESDKEEVPVPDNLQEDLALVNAYQRTFDDDQVDVDLCARLIKHIDESADTDAAILVFLPGYDEIMRLQFLLTNGDILRTQNTVLPLHSNCTAQEQRLIFRKPQQGRKIVLSTNIAETSLTIDDVVFVIDAGRVKEKIYDEETGVGTLQAVWVSKASARQRRGRAGRCRPGVCFHLFSQRRHAYLAEHQTPELLKTPLAELCLQARIFCEAETLSISEFLAKAPDPPRTSAVRHAIDILQKVGGLDKQENVTPLGHRLSRLSLEPQLGKMVLVGYALGCLDQILCLAACRAHRSPFLLPMNPRMKTEATSKKRQFAQGIQSDHYAVINAFAQWQAARQSQILTSRSFFSKWRKIWI